jgi:hypothetical protein
MNVEIDEPVIFRLVVASGVFQINGVVAAIRSLLGEFFSPGCELLKG